MIAKTYVPMQESYMHMQTTYVKKDHVPYSNSPVFERRITGDHNGTKIPGIKCVEILPNGYMMHVIGKDLECVLPLPYHLLGKKRLFRDLDHRDMRKVAVSIFSDEADIQILVRDLEKVKRTAIAMLDREREKSGSHGLVEASL